MKLKKLFMILTMGAMMAAPLTACGSTGAEATTVASSDAKENSSNEAFISYNGVELYMDMTFDSVKDNLGDEIQPSETIEPCGGGDYIQILHYYKGLTVTTLRDETLIGLQATDDSVLAQGSVKIGDPAESVKSAISKTPDNEDENMISYSLGKSTVMFYIENGKVTGINYMPIPE
ncbi:MAG: hypothetical protein K6E28_09215 [Eubacterium sp.]|nr:hypothetical protein [Eubacterium sp.]